MLFQPAKAVCLAVLSPLLLCQCSSLPHPIAVEGELGTPESSLPRYEYPFDESGRYREDWVGSPRKGDAASSASRGHSASPARPSSPVRTTSSVPVKAPAPAPAPAPVVLTPVVNPPSRVLLASTGGMERRRTTHTVNRGETLWSISRQYGVSVTDLKAENGISADVIHAGDTIRLP